VRPTQPSQQELALRLQKQSDDGVGGKLLKAECLHYIGVIQRTKQQSSKSLSSLPTGIATWPTFEFNYQSPFDIAPARSHRNQRK
jgi:hypothetical protein